MASNSNIEWTDTTWSPITGCTRASAGCDHCYSVTMTHRLEAMGQKKYAGLTVLNGKGDRHFNGVVKCHEDELMKPLKWRKPKLIFVNSMSDTFHRDVPFEFIDKIFAVMAMCPQHQFQVLTKRPERMQEYLEMILDEKDMQRWVNAGVEISNSPCAAGFFENFPLPNVWLGTSVENQKAASERIRHLLNCPAAIRFLSVEPLLEPILFEDANKIGNEPWRDDNYLGFDWCIIGGESGHEARPCSIGAIRAIVEQCKNAGVPVFVKQLGKWITGPHDFDGWKGAIDRWLLNDGTVFRRPILRSQLMPHYYDERPKNAVAWGLADPKGGDIHAWPSDLRIREMPAVAAAKGVA